MGIAKDTVFMLLRTLRKRKTSGRALTLGVQGIGLQYDEAKTIFANYEYAVPAIEPDQILLDGHTQYGNTIHQKVFFKMLGYNIVESMDCWTEEGADFIHDLNRPIPRDLAGQFNLVYDGGTLEHVFDVKECLFNVVRLLQSEGMVIHHSPMNGYVNHGFYQFSPTLFEDFYAANGFTNCELYYHYRIGKSYYYVKHVKGAKVPLSGLGEECLSYFIATRGNILQEPVVPMQGMYAKGL